MIRPYVKPVLPVLSGAGIGFYLGGRYVGGMASDHAADHTLLQKTPEWISQANQTMWLMLAVSIACVCLWVWLDYTE